MKKSLVSILMGIAIGIPLSLFIVGEQEKQYEEYEQRVEEYRQTEYEVVEIPETTIQPNKGIETGSAEPVPFYDIPLSAEIQAFIVEIGQKHNISPSVIIAIIERESRYDADVVGDSGRSYGLMQIQPMWHQERMNCLGVTDLLDPIQNITVGVDILVELREQNSELVWVLMAYNGGTEYATTNEEKGIISDYAKDILKRISELEE